MKRSKKLDCVEMMHRGGARVRALTADMTLEEELAFWRTRDEELIRKQEALREKRKAG